MRDMTVVLIRAFLLTVSVVGIVIAQDSPECRDPNTPRLPPHGVLSQAGYGAPCNRIPCQPGMSCCRNAQRKLVCEDVNECTSQTLNRCTQKCINSYGDFTCSCDRQGFSLHEDGATCQLTNLDALADCGGVDQLCECERKGGDEICSETFPNTVCDKRGACVCGDNSSLNLTTGDCIKEPCPIEYVLNPVSLTCLRLGRERVNWTTASDRCAAESETLAVFPTQKEVEWLKVYTENYWDVWTNDHLDGDKLVKSPYLDWYDMYPWIGLIESNGWKWVGRSNDKVSHTDPIWHGIWSNTNSFLRDRYANTCGLYLAGGVSLALPEACDITLPYYICERIPA